MTFPIVSRKALCCAALAAFLALGLGACDQKKDEDKTQSTPPSTESTMSESMPPMPAVPGPAPAPAAAPASTTEAPAPEAAPAAALPDFSSAGIDDPKPVLEFLGALKQAAANDDREALADMVRYPFSTYDNGAAVKTYADKAALMEDFDSLFTPGVKAAIESATPQSLFTNSQGVMIGNGEIWFDNSSGAMKIKTINAH